MCDIMDGERKLIIQPIEREMHRSYIDYSMSVIVGRCTARTSTTP